MVVKINNIFFTVSWGMLMSHFGSAEQLWPFLCRMYSVNV